MESKHPINEVIDVTMDKVRTMVDANTVIGTPIETAQGVTIIPVSKISVGFGSGGADFVSKNQTADKGNSFGGGTAAGVNIDPVGFLVVTADSVRLLPMEQAPAGPIEKVIDLMPELMGKMSSTMDKRRSAKKQEKEEKVEKVEGAE